MIVVSDTTPISSLFRIGKLEYLKVLFPQVIIATAVYKELLRLEDFGEDISEIKNADWILVKQPADKELVTSLTEVLDIGESEAIALAKEIGADLIIVDEKRARLKAKELGIATTGLLGVISQLKQIRYIDAVKPVIDELRLTGFWVNEHLYQKILSAEGE